MTGKEWKKFLYDNEICDAYQYISNTRKSLDIALYCKELIISLISKMESDHNDWQNKLYERLFNSGNGIRSVAISASNMPTYNIDICGIETSIPFNMVRRRVIRWK